MAVQVGATADVAFMVPLCSLLARSLRRVGDKTTVLVRVQGRDEPGVTAAIFGVIAGHGVELYDVEQLVVRSRLTLDILIGVSERDAVLKDLLIWGQVHGVRVEMEAVEAKPPPRRPRYVVTLAAVRPTPAGVAAVTSAIDESGCNIERIVRLSRSPLVSFELVVEGPAGHDRVLKNLRCAVVAAARAHDLDVAVQREGLERQAKRLVVMDVDMTLIQNEVIDLLAEEAGRGAEVAAVTARAMTGEMDFAESLRARAACLAGLDEAVFQRVRARIRVTDGARTFVRTLHRLGCVVAAVSGGFAPVVGPLAAELGIDHFEANELEIVDGHLTGQVLGRIVDRGRKAEVLRELAKQLRCPIEQTVAIGDGANDLDMLAAAGLGVAFNAKPAVREAADAGISVPYLDGVLCFFGLTQDQIEAAEQAILD